MRHRWGIQLLAKCRFRCAKLILGLRGRRVSHVTAEQHVTCADVIDVEEERPVGDKGRFGGVEEASGADGDGGGGGGLATALVDFDDGTVAHLADKQASVRRHPLQAGTMREDVPDAHLRHHQMCQRC